MQPSDAAPLSVPLAEPYTSPAQQQAAATSGMWLFLATEALFFGGMLAAYAVYRYLYPAGFSAGGALMSKSLGTINTGILLTSSLAAALAVRASRRRGQPRLVLLLGATALLGLLFDAVKFYEYYEHIRDHLLPSQAAAPLAVSGERLFFVLYYVMTAVHAVHVMIGVVLFATLAAMALQARGRLSATKIEVSALYWHFVDLVWIFLYPLFYLVGGR